MATQDERIKRLTSEVLAERQLPSECSAILIHDNPLTEVKLGGWAKSRYSKIRFRVDSSGADDPYDKAQIGRELDRLPVLPEAVGGQTT